MKNKPLSKKTYIYTKEYILPHNEEQNKYIMYSTFIIRLLSTDIYKRRLALKQR